MPRIKRDWNSEAARVAAFMGRHHFHAHRGAAPWSQRGVSVAFGNDCYADDPRTQKAVAALRRKLVERGWPVLGFGVDPEDGYSWAMLVRTAEAAELYDLVWEGWGEGWGEDLHNSGYAAVQGGIATSVFGAFETAISDN